MKLFILFFLTLISITYCNAQSIVWNGKNKSIDIAEYVSVLEDTSGKLTIDQVSGIDYANRFKLSEKKILSFGITESWQWIKISITNNTHDKLLLELAQAFLPYTDFYYKDKTEKWKVVHAGFKVPLDQKIIRHHYQLFPIPDSTSEIYVHFISHVQPIPVRLWNANNYEEKATNQKLYYGIYSGILIFVIVNNLFWFFTFRRWTYLHYSSMVVFHLAIAASVMDGFVLYVFVLFFEEELSVYLLIALNRSVRVFLLAY